MSDTTLAVKTIKNSMLNIASFLIGLLINFYLLRYVVAVIGIDSFGISALLFVIIAPLNLTNLGFGEATTKYVAEYVHLKQFQKAGTYIRTTFFMNLMVGMVGSVLVFFFGGDLVMLAFAKQIIPAYHHTVEVCMKIIALGWLFNQISATFMGVPVALQHFKKVATGNIIYYTSIAIFTFLFLKYGYGLIGYTLATVLGQFTTTCYWYYTAQKIMPGISLAPRLDKSAWKESFQYGGWQTISQFGGLLAQQAEKYVMGVMLSIGSVGIYNVVLNIEQKVYAIVHKLAEVLFPMFSALSNDTPERRANILIKSSWIITSLAVSMLVSVIPFAHSLILMWMKNIFLADQGSFVLQVICLAGAFGSATTAGYFFLLGIGKTQKITYISILTGVVTVITALLVLPVFGLRGAGIAALTAAIVQSIAITRVMYTALKGVMPLQATITAVFAPILTGSVCSFLVTFYFSFTITNWFVLGGAYLLMFCTSAFAILAVTRILPHGKEHVDLLKKLFTHLKVKLQARF